MDALSMYAKGIGALIGLGVQESALLATGIVWDVPGWLAVLLLATPLAVAIWVIAIPNDTSFLDD